MWRIRLIFAPMKNLREERLMGLVYALSLTWLLHWLAQTAVARTFSYLGRPELSNFFAGGEPTGPAVFDHVRASIAAVQIFAFGLTGAAFLWAYFGRGALKTAFVDKISFRHWIIAVLVVVASQPMIQWTVLNPETFSLPWPQWESDLERVEARNFKLLEGLLPNRLALNLLVIALLPAIMEEAFFRGFVLKTLQTVSGVHAAVWISALLFSALHFQAFGFVGRTLLGAIFGYVTMLSGGSLWPAISAHFVNNAAFVVAAYFWGLSEVNRDAHWVAAAISAIAVVGLLLYWKARLYKAE